MSLHTSIALTAALAAMACTVPGLWLVLRRQSMMGDALSHTALPGIVIAFLTATALQAAGWISAERLETIEHLVLLAGAAAAGLVTAWLTEWVREHGRVEANAALGVVFTGLFALGLFLVRYAADDVHLDTDCVLFGRVVDAALDTVSLRGWEVPRAALINGGVLVVNLLLLVVCYKELKISAFDPGLATVQGINARGVHYAHMAVTAVTAVAAFETVGSILVVGLLVVPAATAQLLTRRLQPLIVLSLLIAAVSAVLGHWASQTIPGAVFSRIGFPQVEDASTPGMIAVVSGLLFVLAWGASPRDGLLAGSWKRLRLRVRILAEDLLGALYRQSERHPGDPLSGEQLIRLARRLPAGGLIARWLLGAYTRRGLLASSADGYSLTPRGEVVARRLVRGHRLWETYVDKHFELPSDHLDSSAHRAEHFLTEEIQQRLEQELDAPQADPHGRDIPSSPVKPER